MNFFTMQHPHSGRPGRERGLWGPRGQHGEAIGPGELQGPFHSAESGCAGWRGPLPGRRPHPPPHRPVSDPEPPPNGAAAGPEARGARAAAGSAPGGLSQGGYEPLRPSPAHEPSPAPGQASQTALQWALPGPAARVQRPLPPPRAYWARLPSCARPRGPARGSRLLAGPAAHPAPVRHAAHWAGRRATSPLIGGSPVCHPAVGLSRAGLSSRRRLPHGKPAPRHPGNQPT